MPRDEHLPLTGPELEAVKRIAKRENISEEEAATRLVQSALARRVRRHTGKAPARIYGLRRK